MADLLSVDVGYSSIKATFEDGETFYAPSTVAPYFAQGIVGVGEDHFIINGFAKTVGRPGSTRGNIGEKFHGSEDWYALMCFSFLQLAKKEGLYKEGAKASDQAIVVQVNELGIGVPFLQYTKSKLAELQAYTHYEFVYAEQSFVVDCTKVSVFYQGLTTLILQGKGVPFLGLVDVGYYSCDFILISEGKVNTESSKTLYKGVNRLHHFLNVLMIKELGCRNQGSDSLDNVLATKKFWFKGEEHDLTHLVDKAIAIFSERLDSLIRQTWGDRFKDIREIHLTGGGSYYLDDFEEGDTPCIRPEDPIFANSKAYLKMMRMRRERTA